MGFPSSLHHIMIELFYIPSMQSLCKLLNDAMPRRIYGKKYLGGL